MNRSNYREDIDIWALIRWRGAVKSAINGKRGQEFLKELLAALDSMQDRVLIKNKLECDGQFCALGLVGNKRGLDLSKLDPFDPIDISEAFDIAQALAQEIAFINDYDYDCYYMYESKEARWNRMRKWVHEQITS